MTYPTTTNTGSYIRSCGYCCKVRTCRIVQLSPTLRAYYCDDCVPFSPDDADALLDATHREPQAWTNPEGGDEAQCPHCKSLLTVTADGLALAEPPPIKQVTS